MNGRWLFLLALPVLAACPDERDGPRRCRESRECPVVDCGQDVTLQFCHENYCETDPDIACDQATTVSSGSGGAGGS